MATFREECAKAAQGYETRLVGGAQLVVSPGKFEGEPIWLVYLWDLALESFADSTEYDGDTEVSVFEVDAEMRVYDPYTFAESSVNVIRVWENDQGFVCWRTGAK